MSAKVRSTRKVPPLTLQQHVLLTVVKDHHPCGYRIMDMRRAQPIVKELGLRALAAHPHLAGLGWELDIRLAGTDRRCLRINSYREAAVPGEDGPLAAFDLPLVYFEGQARSIARNLSLDAPYEYYIRPLDPKDDESLLQKWQAQEQEDVDFDVTGASASLSRLSCPGNGLTIGCLPEETLVVVGRGSWLKCVFSRDSFDRFVEAASVERERERGWAALGETYLTEDSCWTVIADLVELPVAEARRASILTTGRDFLAFHKKANGRLVGYAHLHPRTLEGYELRPVPSGPDLMLAMNLEGATPLPCCFPIALFETDFQKPNGSLAVHAFVAGMLSEISVEVQK